MAFLVQPLAIFLSGGVGPATLGATIAANLIVGVSSLAISRALQSQKAGAREVSSDFTTFGDEVPQSIPLGRCHTRGHQMCAHYAYKNNKRRIQIYQLSSLPINGLDVVYINGQKYTVGENLVESDVQDEVQGTCYVPANDDDAKNKVIIRFFDGTQTAASRFLTDNLADHEERPWTDQHKNIGNAYAVLEFRDVGFWKSEPAVSFVIRGASLLDPRTNQTAFTENAMVIGYNVLRGIPMPDGSTAGLNQPAARLPAAMWMAAMDECDERGYQFGFEWFLKTDLAGDGTLDVMDFIAAASDAEYADVAGDWFVRVGGSGAPSQFWTDADFNLDGSEELNPVAEISEARNAVRVTVTSPDDDWQAKVLPLRVNAAAVQRDGGVRAGSVRLEGVNNTDQGQRLGEAWVKDAARRKTLSLVMTGLSVIAPLDAAALSVDRYGFDNKTFDVDAVYLDPYSAAFGVQLRECDPADRVWSSADLLPVAQGSTAITARPLGVIDDFSQGSDTDESGYGRVTVAWSTEEMTFQAVQVQLRRDGTIVADETVRSNAGVARIGGLQLDEVYQVQARGLDFETVWTGWVDIRTPEGAGQSRKIPLDLAEVFDRVDQSIDATTTEVLRNRLDFTSADTDAAAARVLAETRVDDAFAAVTEEATARASADGALAGRMDTVEIGLGQTEAAVVTEAQARADGDSALASQLATVSADLDDATAAITGLSVTQAEADAALAADITNLSASLGQTNVTLSEQAQALVDLNYAVGSYTWAVEAEGAAAMLKLYATTDLGTGAAQSGLHISSDYFVFDGDFATFMSGAKIDGSLIVDGSITTAHLSTASFQTDGLAVFGGALQSSNYVAGQSGWRIDHDGSMEVNQLLDRSAMAANFFPNRWVIFEGYGLFSGSVWNHTHIPRDSWAQLGDKIVVGTTTGLYPLVVSISVDIYNHNPSGTGDDQTVRVQLERYKVDTLGPNRATIINSGDPPTWEPIVSFNDAGDAASNKWSKFKTAMLLVEDCGNLQFRVRAKRIGTTTPQTTPDLVCSLAVTVTELDLA